MPEHWEDDVPVLLRTALFDQEEDWFQHRGQHLLGANLLLQDGPGVLEPQLLQEVRTLGESDPVGPGCATYVLRRCLFGGESCVRTTVRGLSSI